MHALKSYHNIISCNCVCTNNRTYHYLINVLNIYLMIRVPRKRALGHFLNNISTDQQLYVGRDTLYPGFVYC